MEERNQRYFNFPIELLEGFMLHSDEVLKNIMSYAIYVKYKGLKERLEESGEEFEWYNGEEYSIDDMEILNIVLKYFRIKSPDPIKLKEEGYYLYYNYEHCEVKTGLNTSIFWDYFNKEKKDFDKISLLGHLAFKSIIQNKSYNKITRLYLLSRMDGKSKSIKDFSLLSKEIFKYSNHYQSRKLKEELNLNWGIEIYSPKNSRGFYASYKMSIDDLIYQAEKRRKKNRIEKLKLEKQKAYSKAMDKLRRENLN